MVNDENIDTIFDYDLNGHLQEYRMLSKDTEYYDEILNAFEYFYKNGPVRIYFANGHLKASGIVKNHRYGNQ